VPELIEFCTVHPLETTRRSKNIGTVAMPLANGEVASDCTLFPLILKL